MKNMKQKEGCERADKADDLVTLVWSNWECFGKSDSGRGNWNWRSSQNWAVEGGKMEDRWKEQELKAENRGRLAGRSERTQDWGRVELSGVRWVVICIVLKLLINTSILAPRKKLCVWAAWEDVGWKASLPPLQAGSAGTRWAARCGLGRLPPTLYLLF